MGELAIWTKKQTTLERAAELFTLRKPPLDPVSYFKRLPSLCLCSNTIKTRCPSSGIMPLDRAINAPWLALDSDSYRNAILLDIDHADGVDLWLALPDFLRPHLVLDPYSGRSAAIYWLAQPVPINGGYGRMERLLSLTAALCGVYFKATVLPHKSLAKNPFGLTSDLPGGTTKCLVRRTKQPTAPDMYAGWKASKSPFLWHTLPGADEHQLSDLARWLQELDLVDDIDTKMPTKKRAYVPDATSEAGRNAELFSILRYWCYAQVERDYSAILAKATEINEQFLPGLPVMELESIARSISKFMRTKYKPGARCGLDWERGIMRLKGKDMELRDKQRLAAARTADVKASQTRAKLQAIIRHWSPEQRLTKAALARAAGVSVDTVKRAWSDISR